MKTASQRLFKFLPTDHGGELRKKRKGRGSRALAHRHSIHLMLRSSVAKGPLSMTYKSNRKRIDQFIESFALQNGIQLISRANVGNHIHLHIRLPEFHSVKRKKRTVILGHRQIYKRFIRALTGAIALTVMKQAGEKLRQTFTRFWDQRPFSRIVNTAKHWFNMVEYIQINQLEGYGHDRVNARHILAIEFDRIHPPDTD